MFEPLTSHRREFLAKAVMDVVKFVAGMGIVSGLFLKLPFPVQLMGGTMIFGFFVLAWGLYPSKGDS